MNIYQYSSCVYSTSRILVFGSIMLVLAGCQGELESSKESSNNDTSKSTTSEAATESTPSKPPLKTVAVDIPTFMSAALEGKVETVKRAIESGVDINAKDEQKRTALLYASFNGHVPVVKLLLENGALLDHRDEAGRNALMFASTSSSPETVELLLDSGAEVNEVDKLEKFTALMHAAAEGQIKVVQVLLDHDADPDLRDVDGDTARDFAVQNGHAEVAELLKK